MPSAPTKIEVLVSSDADPLSVSALSLAIHQHDAANYIIEMIFELRRLAEAAELYVLMAPLEEAYYAAFSAHYALLVPPGEAERIKGLSKTVEELSALQVRRPEAA